VTASGGVAASEIRRRSRDQLDELQDLTGSEQILLRSETDRLPGDLETERGNFELPGLFTSPDLSPLRLETGSQTSSGISLRLPKLSQPQRVSAFESPDIDAAPPSAAESGFAVRDPGGEIVQRFGPGEGGAANQFADAIDGVRVPDPDTAGAQFLDDVADRNTAYVRPRGDRTTELEAIYPPDSRFERVATGRVDTGGRPATLDVYRRVDVDDTDVGDVDVENADDVDDLLSPAEISARASREPTLRRDAPAAPPVTAPPDISVGRDSSVGLGRSDGSTLPDDFDSDTGSVIDQSRDRIGSGTDASVFESPTPTTGISTATDPSAGDSITTGVGESFFDEGSSGVTTGTTTPGQPSGSGITEPPGSIVGRSGFDSITPGRSTVGDSRPPGQSSITGGPSLDGISSTTDASGRDSITTGVGESFFDGGGSTSGTSTPPTPGRTVGDSVGSSAVTDPVTSPAASAGGVGAGTTDPVVGATAQGVSVAESFLSGFGSSGSGRRTARLPDIDTDESRTGSDGDLLAEQERFVLDVPDPTDIDIEGSR
jgi:hypothetical protein